MPECAKTHLWQCRISKFSGDDPRTPSSRGGEGREERRVRGKGRREGRDRGEREERNGGGGEGRGGERHSTWAPPP